MTIDPVEEKKMSFYSEEPEIGNADMDQGGGNVAPAQEAVSGLATRHINSGASYSDKIKIVVSQLNTRPMKVVLGVIGAALMYAWWQKDEAPAGPSAIDEVEGVIKKFLGK